MANLIGRPLASEELRMSQEFCTGCFEETEHTIEESVEPFTVRGIDFNVPWRTSACRVCGSHGSPSGYDFLLKVYGLYRNAVAIPQPWELLRFRTKHGYEVRFVTKMTGIPESVLYLHERGCLVPEVYAKAMRNLGKIIRAD